MKKIFACLIAFLLFTTPAFADYTYIHNDGEYSMVLPDAPTGVTIWGDDKQVPYLDHKERYGEIGEYATLHITDPATLDYFDAKITFIKAEPEFLAALTKEKVQQLLSLEYKDTQLDQRKDDYSGGTGTLKWATITGYSVDQSNRLLFNAAHFLVGTGTITVVRVQYSLENEKFNEAYKTFAASIKYIGR